MKPVIWKAEPMGHRAKAFTLIARNTSSGNEARRFYGHTLQHVLGTRGLLDIIAYDTRRMLEEIAP